MANPQYSQPLHLFLPQDPLQHKKTAQMIEISKKTCLLALLCTLTSLIFGCSSPVHHMSSNVCLVQQGNSPKEVMDVLGPPNVKKQIATGELWTYYTAQKSPLKRTPGVNLMFGTVTYDVVHITFVNSVVSDCQYRYATEEEFKQSNIAQTAEEQ